MKSIALTALILLPLVTNAETASPVVTREAATTNQGYFPVAHRLKDGRIAVIMRGGAEHLGLKGRLDMIFSSDDGRTWSKPVVVNDSPIDDRNPALGVAKDGTIVVGFWRTATYDDAGKYNPKLSDKERSTWVTRSKDGSTWSEATRIDTSDIELGSPFGRMVTLPDGAMLMAIYGYEVRPSGQKLPTDRNHSYIYRSTDDGQTWKRFSEIGDGKQQLNETAIERLSSGKIIAAMRSRAGEVWLSESTDDGATWSKTRQLTPVNAHPADLCQLPDGRVLMTVGNRLGAEAGFGVFGLVSDANGEFDWNKRFNLVTDALSRDCGYPSSVSLMDGRALTLYYATRVKEHPEWKVHCGAVTFEVSKL